MQVIKTAALLDRALDESRNAGRVGFVPTMGALHDGHLQLVAASKAACATTVVSIFVNPTQFNQSADLETYPRTPGRDVRLLEAAGCDVVFLPTVEAVYPPGLDTILGLDFGKLETVMEGAQRPGHFAGVAQVVNRLLDLVRPDALFMGQKDYQQVAIVREMLRQTKRSVELIAHPIVREADGLAMSSRNRRLSPAMRAKAPTIYASLQGAAEALGKSSVAELIETATARMQAAGLRPEYLSVAHPTTLQPVGVFDPAEGAVLCAAAWAGDVRLIDNILVEARPPT